MRRGDPARKRDSIVSVCVSLRSPAADCTGPGTFPNYTNDPYIRPGRPSARPRGPRRASRPLLPVFSLSHTHTLPPRRSIRRAPLSQSLSLQHFLGFWRNSSLLWFSYFCYCCSTQTFACFLKINFKIFFEIQPI